MMNFSIQRHNGPVHAEDLQPILEFLETLTFRGDGQIEVDHNAAGVYIKLIQDETAVVEEGGTTPVSQVVFAGELTTASNGVYTITNLQNDLSITGYPLQVNISTPPTTGTTVAVFADKVEAL